MYLLALVVIHSNPKRVWLTLKRPPITTDITMASAMIRTGSRPVNEHDERRAHPRYALSPMYTPIALRLTDDETFKYEGHAYDISRGGIRFELDRGIEPGTRVALRITLPNWGAGGDIGPGRAVFAFANIVWIEDEDAVGPVRMAAVFTNFCRAGDERRLMSQLQSGRFALAA